MRVKIRMHPTLGGFYISIAMLFNIAPKGSISLSFPPSLLLQHALINYDIDPHVFVSSYLMRNMHVLILYFDTMHLT